MAIPARPHHPARASYQRPASGIHYGLSESTWFTGASFGVGIVEERSHGHPASNEPCLEGDVGCL
jgi:hypothetical protein